MRLDGKVAIVAGGAGGIGRAIAQGYAREGAAVVIADSDAAAAAAAACSVGPRVIAQPFDCADQPSIDTLMERTIEWAGRIDILVNAAAIFTANPIETLTREEWRRIATINVEGTLFTLQAAARYMIARGEGGKIINLASMAGRRGGAFTIAYSASKAAVISITQSAALRLIAHRINVNAIAPGEVDTPMWEAVDRAYVRLKGERLGETRRAAEAAVPIGRFAQPADLVGMAVFLASSEADYVVGQTLGVDGGVWLG